LLLPSPSLSTWWGTRGRNKWRKSIHLPK
jgi:hypothetical protein